MNVWLIFLGMAVGTFAWRFSFIYLFGKVELPPRIKQGLRFVPPTVLLGLILPAVIRPAGMIDVSPANPRFYAALIAGVVAYLSKNVLLTIIAGMGSLYLLQALF
jgi:branched-subunit amino acid transport protein